MYNTSVNLRRKVKQFYTVIILPAIIWKLDDIIMVTSFLGWHNHCEQWILVLFPVNNHPSLEEPMSAMFTESTWKQEIILMSFY